MAKEQLKHLLVDRGLASSEEEAMRLIISKDVKVGDEFVTSPGAKFNSTCEITLKETCPYVSRGGIKLKGAIDYFNLSICEKNCLDIGSSTGGFSDCLLQEGARRVACVDVNYGQLAWKVRSDERSAVFERTNIKNADPSLLGAPFDLIAIDVSFIGLASLAPVIKKFAFSPATGKTELIALIKPEFEADVSENEGGLVTDEAVHKRTISEVCEALTRQDFDVIDVAESPIRGKKKGNKEFLLYAKH